ncbi:LysR family transcriptional regulator [Paenibacillus gallinarum]|uniref:LysR family transcriptional regulator n=1 Tax=Paenibacillus gallinarum TaxID=2762232 RepID=A0ABR8T1D6_9BACL|nr:LysR family transcriptional regulator [Paenibacillus gallinarum]MBD7969409.1 LysR family transcriptional regulator [Paenibacillus gallinarum]
MEYLQLKYFQAVAQYENMTKASAMLNVSQPSLSNAIKRLENKIGVPLFDRHGKHLKLNPYGKVYLDKIEEAFRALGEGETEIREMAGLRRGHLTLCMMLPHIMPTLLKEFLAVYPDVRISQRQLNSTTEMKMELDKSNIDFCLSTFPIIGPDIEWLTLVEEEMSLTVPKNHRLASRESIRLSEVSNEPFISLPPRTSFRDITDEYCRQAGFEPNVAFELEETSAILTLVEMGLGITLTLPLSLGNRVHNKDTVQLKIIEPICIRTFGIAWNKKHYLSQAAVHFLQFVKQYFSNYK